MHKTLILLAVLAVAGCTRTVTPTPTTVSAPVPATTKPPFGSTLPPRPTPTTGTTPPANTSSTTPPAATTTPAAASPLASLAELADIVFPDNPRSVADLPAVLTALIGAPVPDPDLTLNAPGDVERWLTEWLAWAATIAANPTTDPAILGLGVLAGTELSDQWRTAANRRAAAGQRLLGYPFIPTRVVLATFDQNYRDRKLLTVVIDTTNHPVYLIDQDNLVVDIQPAPGHPAMIELTLRPNGENEWLPAALQPVGGS